MIRFLILLVFLLNACSMALPWRLRHPIPLGGHVRPELRPLVKAIAQDNQVVRSSLENHPQWLRYQELEHRATPAELLRLTDHASPVVRVYAFEAIATHPEIDLWPLMLRHLPDNVEVMRRGYHAVAHATVGETMLGQRRRFTEAQRRWLDSVLFTDRRIHFDLRQFLYFPRLPVAAPGYYTGIRRLAKRRCHPQGEVCQLRRQEALIALAAYRRPADRRLIYRFLRSANADDRRTGLVAVQQFPDPTFRPQLLALLQLVARDSAQSEAGEWAPDLRKALSCLP